MDFFVNFANEMLYSGSQALTMNNRKFVSIEILKTMTGIATNKVNSEIMVKKDMRDYTTDPYFIKKAEKASSFLKKHGFQRFSLS